MKRLPILSVLLCSFVATVVAQDPVKTNPQIYRVLVDNARVRVLRVSVGPGAKSTMHEHPDNLVVALGNSKVRFTEADGKSQEADLKADQVLWNGPQKHMGENLGSSAVDALVIELKGNAAPSATVPTDRPGLKGTKLLENARVDVVRATLDATFKEPAGTTHPWDSVVIALAPSDTHLTVEGKPKDKWQRGDVLFIGRNVAHEARAGQKSGDVLIVAIK